MKGVAEVVSIISAGINFSKLLSDIKKYPDKKFERILRELRKFPIPVTEEGIVRILSEIIKGQRCERIEVTRIKYFGVERVRKIIRNHFS